MEYLPLLSLVWISAFLIVWKIQFGWKKSVSAYYYELKNKVWFTLALWGFAVPVMIAGFVLYDSIWFALAGAGICFVGAAPDYQEKREGEVHYIAALSGIIIGLIAITLIGAWYVSVPATILILAIHKVKNRTYWQELIAIYSIVLTLYLL
jgi:hypothetical protein